MADKTRFITDVGKGDRLRRQSAEEKQKFNDNFDRIFGKKPKEKKDDQRKTQGNTKVS